MRAQILNTYITIMNKACDGLIVRQDTASPPSPYCFPAPQTRLSLHEVACVWTGFLGGECMGMCAVMCKTRPDMSPAAANEVVGKYQILR